MTLPGRYDHWKTSVPVVQEYEAEGSVQCLLAFAVDGTVEFPRRLVEIEPIIMDDVRRLITKAIDEFNEQWRRDGLTLEWEQLEVEAITLGASG